MRAEERERETTSTKHTLNWEEAKGIGMNLMVIVGYIRKYYIL